MPTCSAIGRTLPSLEASAFSKGNVLKRSDSAHRIFLTGSTGFVGAALVQLLKASYSNCEIVSLGEIAGHARPLDIRDADAVEESIREVKPTAIVHLAAIASPSEARASPREAWGVNVMGTLNLAEAVLRHAPEARFIFVGSSESYGGSFIDAAAPLTEDAALRPRSVYAATKAAADLMIGQMAHDGLKAVRFRPFNHTGPGQSDTYVVSSFARQVAEVASGRRVPVINVGNLGAERDFLDVRDVVRAYAIAATGSELPEGREQVFNLASGRSQRIGTILEKLIALSGREIEVRADPAKLRPNDIPITAGDASAARNILGWEPAIPFDKTLADVYNFWRGKS